MRNKTCEDAADAIVTTGCVKSLIIKTLRAIYGQGYIRGYRAKTNDAKKNQEAKQRAMNKSFKPELDIIDDVRQSKWS